MTLFQASLEKQVKDANVRIVDLETKSMNAPRPAATSRRLESRIEELTNQLNQSTRDSSRMHFTADKAVAEVERQKARLEQEVQDYETRIKDMRQRMDELVGATHHLSIPPHLHAFQTTSQNALQLAKRRTEREAADFKQKSLNLERELERLRSRLERPSSALLGSPASSPRKQ